MANSLRNLFRYGAVALTGVIVGSRTVSAYQAWQQWRMWRHRDPSGAEASLTVAEVDLAVAVVCLGIAGLIWWLLQPPSGKTPDGAAI